jgi:rhamnosyltransferase
MNHAHVCGVVVTFCPPPSVAENLSLLLPQVGGLVVVDNGSVGTRLAWLRAAAQTMGFLLIENGTNLGIAAALNIGVRWARARGFSLVALFDQDSTVTQGFTTVMLAAFAAHPRQDKLAVVTPRQVERSTGGRRVHPLSEDGGPLVTITSGSLMPMTVFEQCGWFQEDLVIDCVDHEYCLRARSLGYTIVECPQATLLVSVGALRIHRAFGMTLHARHYSARRRYYLTRNRMVMVQRFWRKQPVWCCRMLQDVVRDAIKVALVEEHRWSKIKHTGQGLWDALLGRMGMVVEL